MVEALVVGAGPAGSAAALHLARAGHEVLLVDRCRFPRGKPCGEYFNPECVRLLEELGLSRASLRAAGAASVPTLHLGTAGCGSLSVPFAEVLREEWGDGDAGEAMTLGREVLDTRLLEEARRAGVTVWEGVMVHAPLLENSAVTGAVVRVEGGEREVRARITLAADGLRSRIARCLGLGYDDPRRRKFGITGRCALRTGIPEHLEMHARPDGCCGLALRGHEANLGMVVDGSRIREMGGNPTAFMAEELNRYPALVASLAGLPRQVRTVGPLTWRTRRQSTAGCLLLGDAAGFYDPFTGQGVTFALLTARLAAGVAHAALEEGDLSEARLAEYSRRRRALIGPRVGVQAAIQEVLARPWLARRVLGRLHRRPETTRALIGVIADVAPVSGLLNPKFLARLVL